MVCCQRGLVPSTCSNCWQTKCKIVSLPNTLCAKVRTPASPKRTTTTVFADRSGKTNGEPTGRIELKWALMVIGAVLCSSLVLLVAALIAGFTLCRLSRMQRSIAQINATHPKNRVLGGEFHPYVTAIISAADRKSIDAPASIHLLRSLLQYG